MLLFQSVALVWALSVIVWEVGRLQKRSWPPNAN
jgi:hypothetical protein